MSIQNMLTARGEGSVEKNRYAGFDLNIKHPCRRMTSIGRIVKTGESLKE